MTDAGLIKAVILAGVWGLTIANAMSTWVQVWFLILCLFMAVSASVIMTQSI